MSTPEATRKFQFIREIASGGFGSVYLAKVIQGDGFTRLAAVKLLHPKWSQNEEITKRMRDEARLLGWLRHKHIVDVFDLTRIDGRCAVIMEYLEAVDTKIIANWCAEQGALIPLRVALEICAAVASALDAAYNRPPYAGERPLHVIHRDIKPSNIMVDATGLVKVLDFGVARAEFDAREAKTQELSFGSLEYMPPERLFFEPESPASDVYSLGATLYELLALDKLGKAKLRPADQEKFVELRFDELLERHPLPSEQIEDVLHDLLWDMLAFDEVDRPSAADCVTRMRSFARRLQEEGLEEWSERVLPPVVRRFHAEPGSEEAAELVDRLVTEDTAGFAPDGRAPTLIRETPAAPSAPNAEPPSGASARQEERVTPPRAPLPPPPTKPPPPPPPVPPGLRAYTPEELAALSNADDEYGDDLGDDEIDPTVRFEMPHIGLLDETTIFDDVRDGREAQLEGPPADEWEDDEHSTEVGPPAEEPDELEAHAYEDESEFEPIGLDAPSGPIPIAGSEPGYGEPEAEPSGGRGLTFLALGVAAVVAVLVAVVGGVGVLGVLGVGTIGALEGASVPSLETNAPAPAPVASPAPAPAPASAPATPPPAPPEPAYVAGEGAHFVSRLEGTRKIMVRCDEGEGDGREEATVAGAAPGDCTVTAIDGSRKRLTAVVKAVEPRNYVCFVGGDNHCE